MMKTICILLVAVCAIADSTWKANDAMHSEHLEMIDGSSSYSGTQTYNEMHHATDGCKLVNNEKPKKKFFITSLTGVLDPQTCACICAVFKPFISTAKTSKICKAFAWRSADKPFGGSVEAGSVLAKPGTCDLYTKGPDNLNMAEIDLTNGWIRGAPSKECTSSCCSRLPGCSKKYEKVYDAPAKYTSSMPATYGMNAYSSGAYSSDAAGYANAHTGGSGYDMYGYNKAGYDKGGYDKGGYDKSGYNKGGYDKGGYDHKGTYDKGYDMGGSYDKGYDKGGHGKGYDKGYDNGGYDNKGYDMSFVP